MTGFMFLRALVTQAFFDVVSTLPIAEELKIDIVDAIDQTERNLLHLTEDLPTLKKLLAYVLSTKVSDEKKFAVLNRENIDGYTPLENCGVAEDAEAIIDAINRLNISEESKTEAIARRGDMASQSS